MRLMVLVIAAAVLVGCPEPTEKQISIIGEWVTEDDIPATLRRVEFKEGGKLILKVLQIGGHYRVVEGTWERKGDFIDLSVTDGQQQILFEVRITDLSTDLLCWTGADAPAETTAVCYRRRV